jgi:hypothetical protein
MPHGPNLGEKLGGGPTECQIQRVASPRYHLVKGLGANRRGLFICPFVERSAGGLWSAWGYLAA